MTSSPLSEEYRFPGPSPIIQPISSRIVFEPVLETAAAHRAAEAATARNSLEIEEVGNGDGDGQKSAVASRRGSLQPPSAGDLQSRRGSKSSSVGTVVGGRTSESKENQKSTSIVIVVDEDKEKLSRTNSDEDADKKEKDDEEDEDARRLSLIRSRRGSVASMACSTHTVGDGAPDAVERLASWIGDLITPFVFFCLFIVGVPLWFKLDFALPLFLGES